MAPKRTRPDPDAYGPGHPWYYVLGGRPPLPSAICQTARQDGYPGYRTDIAQAGTMSEPHRSDRLRKIRAEVAEALRKDLAAYRKCIRNLRRYRKLDPRAGTAVCHDIHTSISLKHNHLYNDFAHLNLLDSLKSAQLDLFEQ